MIYLLSDFGFCAGVKNSIETLKRAKQEQDSVVLLLPLMHNEIENRKLKTSYHFKDRKEDIQESDAILFPAHGHTLEDEKCFSSHPCYDAICPVLKKRYGIVGKSENLTWYYLGKKEHQESISFLSHFPFMIYVDPDKEYPCINAKNKTGLLVQSTMSEEKALSFQDYLSKNSDLRISLLPCPSYLKRKKDALDFLAKHDATTFDVIVLGSKTSSNCEQLAKSIQFSFPECYVTRANCIDDITLKELKKENILLVSSTSISKESVLAIRDYLDQTKTGQKTN